MLRKPVKSHKRKGRIVKSHFRKIKNDKWPPPFKMNRERLLKYRERVVKEIMDFSTGQLTVVRGHEGHPAFVVRRLKQIDSLLSK